jgi:hypothetical protein
MQVKIACQSSGRRARFVGANPVRIDLILTYKIAHAPEFLVCW